MDRDLLPEGYAKLCKASKSFLNDQSFGHPEIENVMQAVFGGYDSEGRNNNPTAQIWTNYWTALTTYEEEKRNASGSEPIIPKVCLPLGLILDVLVQRVILRSHRMLERPMLL